MTAFFWGAFVGGAVACLVGLLVGFSLQDSASEDDKLRAHLSGEWLIVILAFIVALSMSVYWTGKEVRLAPSPTPTLVLGR